MQSACFAFQESIFNNCSEYEGGAFFRLECCRGNVIFFGFFEFSKAHNNSIFAFLRIFFALFVDRFMWLCRQSARSRLQL